MKIYFAEWNAEYEKYMLNSFKKEHSNIYILNKLMKHFRNYNLKFKKYGISNKWFIKLHQFCKLRKIQSDDIIICNGFSIVGYIDLIKDVNCKKVLVIRDLMSVLENTMKQKKHWLAQEESYIDKVIPYFDHVYSFDWDDCKKYNFEYLEAFLSYTYTEIQELRNTTENKEENIKPICYFVGEYWEDRANKINEITPILEVNNYDTDFNLVHYSEDSKKSFNYPKNCKDTPINYSDNIKKVIGSDVILEITHIGQTGATLRALEAVVLNKKLITNNKSIVNYDFYSPEQIFILDNNYNELSSFLSKTFEPVKLEILYKYTSDAILEKLTNH